MSQGPCEGPELPSTPTPSTPTQRLQPCSTDGGPSSKHRALAGPGLVPAQEGQMEPVSEASLPSPNSPKIPEAWLSYPGDRPALLAGSKDGGSERAGPRPSPTGVTMLRSRASLPLVRGPSPPSSVGPSGRSPPPRPQAWSHRAAGTFCLSLPHVGLLSPVLGTLGGHRASPQSPACLLTHSLWLPGQNCAQVGGAWQPGSFSLFCPLSGASRLQPRGHPLPRLPLPSPGPSSLDRLTSPLLLDPAAS